MTHQAPEQQSALKYTTRLIITLGIIAALFFFLPRLEDIIILFLISLLLYALLVPLVNNFESKGIPRELSIIIVFLIGFVVIGFVLLTLSGCATMFGETTQEIFFTSEPSGARISLGGKTTTTPGSIVIDKRYHKPAVVSGKALQYQPHPAARVFATLPGYDPERITLSSRLDPWWFANMFNLMIGGLVDHISGACIDFESRVHILFTKRAPECRHKGVE